MSIGVQAALPRLTKPAASLSTRRRVYRRFRTLIWVATWLILLVYAIGLLRHGTGFEPFVDGWLGIIVELLPALVCWLAVPSAGIRRREVSCLAAAITAFCTGNAIYIIAAGKNLVLPFPSFSDASYLCFYPLIVVAIVLAVRREVQGLSGSVWLDSALGGLGSACALAILLGPVFAQLAGGVFAKAVAVAYPMFDLLLFATVIGVAALHGWRLRSSWLWPISGLAVFTGADVVYALRVANDSYRIGTILDALWPVGLTLLAGWALSPARPQRAPRPVLAVPVIATLVAVTVLAVATRIHVTSIAVALAVVTLVAVAGRTQLSFRQLRRLGDLRRQATTDDLTELPNRRALYAAINSELAGPLRPRALLLLDLDRFKEVNDSLGHQVGDKLLILAAQRFRSTLESGDVLARLGGDEFAVLLVDCGHSRASEVATQLRVCLTEPFMLEGIALHTGVSIGIALSPEHGNDLTLLLRRADLAMYKAKSKRSGHEVYSGEDDQRGQERLRTIHALRVALLERQFVLHFQPKIALSTGAVHSVEALVRWNHPTRGLLLPASFLELIEESGQMAELTRAVLDQALEQAALWHALGRPLSVAVNLSAGSLLDATLPAYVAGQLAAHRVPAELLQLEITEETLMTERDRARLVLAELRGLGVQISIDDFGTGYSSLAYLRDLPIDELKLDRSFVAPMATDSRARALVASTIGLAHSLGLRMVAEGVEDGGTYSELMRLGCDQVQGYYVCRPIPGADLDRWLEHRFVLPGPRSKFPDGARTSAIN